MSFRVWMQKGKVARHLWAKLSFPFDSPLGGNFFNFFRKWRRGEREEKIGEKYPACRMGHFFLARWRPMPFRVWMQKGKVARHLWAKMSFPVCDSPGGNFFNFFRKWRRGEREEKIGEKYPACRKGNFFSARWWPMSVLVWIQKGKAARHL